VILGVWVKLYIPFVHYIGGSESGTYTKNDKFSKPIDKSNPFPTTPLMQAAAFNIKA
jgi:hypothetical protein